MSDITCADQDDVRAELRRVIVDAHGATIPAIPAHVDDWIDDVFERRDHNATDEAIHWIFENAPQRDGDVELAKLVAMVSKAGRG